MEESILTVLEKNGSRRVRRQISQTKKKVNNKMKKATTAYVRRCNTGGIIYQSDGIPMQVTLGWLCENIAQIYVDLAFQRPEAWSILDKMGYIESVVRNNGNSCLVLADVKDCAKFCKNLGPEYEDDYEYFMKIAKTHKYLSIDGNNRTVSIAEWFNLAGDDKGTKGFANKFAGLPYNLWAIHDKTGVRIEFCGTLGGKIKYKDLPSDVKDILWNRNVTIEMIHEATRWDCHYKFLAINKMKKISNQENRQGLASEWSEFIRIEKEKFEWICKRVDTLTVKMRKIDEFILALYLHCGYDEIVKLNKTKFDEPYDYKKTPAELNQKTSKTIIHRALKLVEDHDDNNELNGIHTLFNWVMYYNYCVKNKMIIYNDVELLKTFIAVQNTLLKDTTLITMDGNKPFNFRGCCSAFTVKKMSACFEYLVREMSMKLTDNIIKVNEFSDIDKDLLRIFTPKQRYELWEKAGGVVQHYDENGNYVPYQDAVCEITGRNIPLREVLDGSRWEADHIIKWEDNGPTTVENGRLIAKRENRRMGGRPKAIQTLKDAA